MDELTRKALLDTISTTIEDMYERDISDTDLEGLNREELACISECLQFGQFKGNFEELRDKMMLDLLKDKRIGRNSLAAFLEIMKKHGFIEQTDF